MSEAIARQWLQKVEQTANAKAFSEHMDLISKRISLHGVPGFENIGYDDWYRQCQYEFENNILKSVHYEGFKPVTETKTAIMFKTFEIVEGTDGIANAHGVEILLEQEADGQWRMVQQRIMPDDETAHAQLLPQYLQQ